ncbi:MAG: MFS transporter [Verrucomicrobiales bacterium]|nr:MFS transporter [Verrucomicrobiales bacterium]MDP4940303.1 MFS transporter [Verrucomicrobiales bacterium]MDP5005749.1 MFS transporter [Verrucomicrobiales bacterium]
MSRNSLDSSGPWYSGITRYEWLILIIASAGWIFDVYEGQIFNLTRNNMLGDILGQEPGSDEVKKYGDWFLGIFLLGGTFGGLLFGSLADRYGRSSIMIVTILMYSVFSGLTFFATELWHVTALRFLVAMGVGGEWAVAAALVSEVFPKKARAHASSIFHASSVIGTSLASLAAIWVGANWEYAYLIGVLPALLIVWVRIVVKEPEKWQRAREEAKAGTGKVGSFKELLTVAPWRGHAFGAMALAAVGLGTFWAVTVAGQDLAREMLISEGATPEEASQKAKFAYGIIQTMGGGLGLVLFGPISARIGRRMTFILFHVAALAITLVVCFLPNSYTTLLILLPVFGFFTLGMHAGYAVYFPELFPDRLRATGMSWGFNGGRLLAATLLILSGKMKAAMDLNIAIAWLGGFFLLGVVVIFFLPETKGKELPT